LNPYWHIQMSHEVEAWLDSEPVAVRERVDMVLTVLRAQGPGLGRPLVDSISGSVIGNLKELRVFSSSDRAIRILFCFTASRIALLLVAGDKSNSWNSWYPNAIKQAEEIYERYLEDKI
jgi:hypothetical protein